jgi:hypothetical protein
LPLLGSLVFPRASVSWFTTESRATHDRFSIAFRPLTAAQVMIGSMATMAR